MLNRKVQETLCHPSSYDGRDRRRDDPSQVERPRRDETRFFGSTDVVTGVSTRDRTLFRAEYLTPVEPGHRSLFDQPRVPHETRLTLDRFTLSRESYGSQWIDRRVRPLYVRLGVGVRGGWGVMGGFGRLRKSIVSVPPFPHHPRSSRTRVWFLFRSQYSRNSLSVRFLKGRGNPFDSGTLPFLGSNVSSTRRRSH